MMLSVQNQRAEREVLEHVREIRVGRADAEIDACNAARFVDAGGMAFAVDAACMCYFGSLAGAGATERAQRQHVLTLALLLLTPAPPLLGLAPRDPPCLKTANATALHMHPANGFLLLAAARTMRFYVTGCDSGFGAILVEMLSGAESNFQQSHVRKRVLLLALWLIPFHHYHVYPSLTRQY